MGKYEGTDRKDASARPIFFCHVPKTAGWALRIALQSKFDQSDIVPNSDMIRANGGIRPPQKVVVQELRRRRGKVGLFLGHFHYSLRQFLDNPLTIMVLRDPIARTISHLKHNVARNGLSKKELYTALDAGSLPIPDNQMTRMLATPRIWQERGSIGALDVAFSELKTVDILGITEDLVGLRERLREIDVNLQENRVNSAPRIRLPLTSEHLDVIQRNNEIDLTLYAYTKLLLSQRAAFRKPSESVGKCDALPFA